MKTFGIDVSKWQGNFDFSKAKKEGITFAILKAGGSDAGRYKDKKFDTYYAECERLNIPVGAYYFGKDKTIEDANKSAEHFVKLLRGKRYHLPVYYDVEGAMLSINRTLLTQIIIAFCSKVASYGYKVGIYTSQSVFNNQVDDKQLLNYSHWIARWSKSEPGKLKSGANMDVWQYGGTQNFIRSNKIAGVTCDQDYCYINFELNVESGQKKEESKKIVNSNKPTDYVYGDVDLSPVFDVEYYYNKYPDLRERLGNNLLKLFSHFCVYGMKEARQGCASFNPVTYRKNYPDLDKAYGDNWMRYYQHYLLIGIHEGRKGY